MGSGTKNRKKKIGMGDYLPTQEEQEAMRFCIDKRIVKIAPKAVSAYNNTEWYIDIWSGGKWNTSPTKYGPGEVWEQIYTYYVYYRGKSDQSDQNKS